MYSIYTQKQKGNKTTPIDINKYGGKRKEEIHVCDGRR